MDTIIKLAVGDIITRRWGKNICIATDRNDFSIIFDPEAAVEFARDVMVLIPGGFDGSDDLTVVDLPVVTPVIFPGNNTDWEDGTDGEGWAMRESLTFLMESFDLHLGRGTEPGEAWQKAVEDYAAVYHVDDDRTILARASAVVLDRMNAPPPDVQKKRAHRLPRSVPPRSIPKAKPRPVGRDER